MKKSLMCVILSMLVLLLSVTMTVNAQTNDENGMTGAADLIAPTSADSPVIVSVSAGFGMSSAVRADGSVWAWGGSGTDFRGVAVGADVNAPTMIASKNTKSAKCSQYYNYRISYSSRPDTYYTNTALLKNDNSLWLFGGNEYGAIGNGDTQGNLQKQPYKVLDNVVDYDVAGYRSAAVTEDGKLYMWGYNRFGQIGNNSTDTVYTPVEVLSDVVSVSLSAGAEQYSSGNGHSAAIKKDGSLWMWGCNKYGQLGDGTTEDSHVPKKITDNVKQVALGESFTVVLKNDGSVWTCGNNGSGQLAKGTIQSYYMDKETHWSNGATYIDNMWPTNVPDADKTLRQVVDLEDYIVTTIEAGYDNAAAISSFGTLYVWGNNRGYNWGEYSKLGNGSTATEANPFPLRRNVKMVSLGFEHALMVDAGGKLWAWGSNHSGEIGDCTNENRNRPVEVTLGEVAVNFYVEDVGTKTMTAMWDDNYFNKNANTYNPELAVNGVILSEAAYSDSSVMSQYGFKLLYNGQSNDSIDKPGYLIGYKILYDYGEPRVEIFMAIRGTKSFLSVDALTDIKSVNDGFDGPTNYCYNIMKSAKERIASELGSLGLPSAKKNIKFFITGHSLGGACAGKMALKMSNDGVAYSNNLYVYTYAAPNYTNIDQQLDSIEDLSSIFNIVNKADVVPQEPKLMGYYWLWPINLYKGGHTFELSSENVSDFFTHIYNLYGETPIDLPLPVKAHKTAVYMALVEGLNDRISSFDPAEFLPKPVYRILSVHCPVDVEVYDADNELCASSYGEKVTYPKISPVRILVIGEEKYIELPDDDYTVRYIGTDTGKMKIQDQLLNTVSGEVESEKAFNNVSLEKGKLFASSIIGDDDTSQTDLNVIDQEGDNTYLVDVAGNETKLAKYQLNPDDVHINADDRQYDGTEKTVEVTVDNLTEGEDYRVIYKNNTEIGTATVTVKGINEYEGRCSSTFDIFDSGTCPDGLTWTLAPSHVLTISGNAAMSDYGIDEDSLPPWQIHKDKIQKIVIEDGVKSIGDNAFIGCVSLEEVIIPKSVTIIGENAFDTCEKLKSIMYSGSEDDWNKLSVGNNNVAVQSAVKFYDFSMTYLLGDADGNNEIESVDATFIQRFLAEIETPIPYSILIRGDVDGSGALELMDVTAIQYYLCHLKTNYPIGQPIT